MSAPVQQPSQNQIWTGDFFADHRQNYVILHLRAFDDGHFGTWDDHNYGNYDEEEERKIVTVEGFQYGAAVSLTWEFEEFEGEYEDDEENYYYWGFSGHFNDIRTEIIGYFYYFAYDYDTDYYTVSQRYEGKISI